MSADWWMTLSCVPNCPHPKESHEGPSFNLTYNLNPMLREAGWTWPDGRVWSKEHLEGVPASTVGEKAMHVLRNLESDPARYRAMNPDNGWGTYDGLLETWRDFVEAIRQYPDAKIGCWL